MQLIPAHRRKIEEAIHAAEHPRGMSTHDGMARIDASILRRLLAIVDSITVPEGWQAVLTTVLQSALRALEESVDLVQSEYDTNWRQGMPTRKGQLDAMLLELANHKDAIELLKKFVGGGSAPEKSRSQRLREAGFTRRPTWRSLPKDGDAASDKETGADKCPDNLTPDGQVCPRCGGRRGPSGVDGGSWVHY